MSESAAVIEDVKTTPAPLGARASVAMWFAALFMLIMLQCAVGGFVRLSESGLSIPDWPLLDINGEKSLLPPLSDDKWLILRDKMEDDYDRLLELANSDAVGIGKVRKPPHDLSEFKVMFYIEWSHRAVVSFISIITLACLITTYRNAEVRNRLKLLPVVILGLIAFQAILGGILVLTGTNTSMLFIHLAIAAILLAMALWCILKLLQDDLTPIQGEEKAARKKLKICTHMTMGLLLIQLMLGALVAGSKHNGFSSQWPLMHDQLIPSLWMSGKSVWFNLFDNSELHQWVHRWFAWLVVAAFGMVMYLSSKIELPPRLKLSLKVAGTFFALQIILGISNIFYDAASILVALSHLLMAMFIVSTLVIAMFDIKYEQKPTQEGAV